MMKKYQLIKSGTVFNMLNLYPAEVIYLNSQPQP